MLEKVTLTNFKSHRLTELNLDDSRLHALVGQNSSGKTSILQALHCLSRLANEQFKTVFEREISPEFIATVGQDLVSVTGGGFWKYQNNRKDWTASYRFQQNDRNDWQPVASWKIGIEEKEIDGWLQSLNQAPDPIPTALKYAAYLKLVATKLSEAAYSEAVHPKVEFDGSMLAPTLDYLRSETPDQFQHLQEMLKRIVPGIREVGIRRAKVKVNRQRLIEINGKSISYDETQ